MLSTIWIALQPFFLALFGVEAALMSPGGDVIIPTVLRWILSLSFFVTLRYSTQGYWSDFDGTTKKILYIYFSYLIFQFIRGFIISDNYWFYKFLLENTMALMMPAAAGFVSNPRVLMKFLRGYIFIALPFFLVILVLSQPRGYGYYLALIPLFLLMIPYLSKKAAFLFLGLALFVVVSTVDSRSNILKMLVPVSLLVVYYLAPYLFKYAKLVCRILLVIPIVFLIIGIAFDFSIFSMGDYVESSRTRGVVADDGSVVDYEITADTRTFIYEEAISSSIDNDYYLIGRTPARGYNTIWFREYSAFTGVEERPSSEVSILNVYTWTGLAGVLIYFVIFYRAIYLALNYSDNYFSKMLAIFVAFRWAYAWVEDFTLVDLNYCVIWLSVGLCYSREFRSMGEIQLKNFLSKMTNFRRV